MDQIRGSTWLTLCSVLAASSVLAGRIELSETLEQQFQNPPQQARPWVFLTGELTVLAVPDRDGFFPDKVISLITNYERENAKHLL
jgi:hypothetical protein